MKVAFCVTSDHQVAAARALIAGIQRCGDMATISGKHEPSDADALACWGWRKGRRLAARGRNVLVMERAYVGDRFVWTSLGWNGLNGRAIFPTPDDGTRWRKYFSEAMRPWQPDSGQRRALIIGQVPTDTACLHVNFAQWANDTARHLKSQGFDVRFRPHPKAAWLRIGAQTASGPVQFRDDHGLEADFGESDVVVTFNSNAGVLAALHGVPTIACDPGSMAWPVASHDLDEPLVRRPDRTAWAHRLACCQWLPEEMSDGTAWAAVRAVLPVREAAA